MNKIAMTGIAAADGKNFNDLLERYFRSCQLCCRNILFTYTGIRRFDWLKKFKEIASHIKDDF